MKKCIGIVALVIGLLMVAIIAFILKFATSIEKSREMEAKVVLGSVVTSLNVYHKEYGKYSDDFAAIGFVPEGAYVAYCFLSSSPECIRYFGRRGIMEDCNGDKAGYIHLAFFCLLGGVFFVGGVIKLLRPSKRVE